jgi:hypothetical protein
VLITSENRSNAHRENPYNMKAVKDDEEEEEEEE